ncbi:MAG: phosphoribosylanthranilate isomerase [Candidatus Fibromonas sp.]|jgi:phosphoribosylanthranilate isomerase|nr:phosphoribosylanthranilate isomerase [Candidatus Fibromonas sp.]
MTKIKICGFFREQDIEFANEAKPDFIGFVFAEKSKRFVDFKQAENLRKNLGKEITPVGVFVNAKISDIISLHKNGIINIIQLHGNEPDEYIRELKTKCEAKIIRAINLNHNSAFPTLNSQLCSYTLLDAKSPGSGHTFDWESLHGLDLSKNVFLAGGVNLGNIKEALKFNPFAVDVSSGAETGGVKDREKILKLVEAVRCG